MLQSLAPSPIARVIFFRCFLISETTAPCDAKKPRRPERQTRTTRPFPCFLFFKETTSPAPQVPRSHGSAGYVHANLPHTDLYAQVTSDTHENNHCCVQPRPTSVVHARTSVERQGFLPLPVYILLSVRHTSINVGRNRTSDDTRPVPEKRRPLKARKGGGGEGSGRERETGDTSTQGRKKTSPPWRLSLLLPPSTDIGRRCQLHRPTGKCSMTSLCVERLLTLASPPLTVRRRDHGMDHPRSTPSPFLSLNLRVSS